MHVATGPTEITGPYEEWLRTDRSLPEDWPEQVAAAARGGDSPACPACGESAEVEAAESVLESGSDRIGVRRHRIVGQLIRLDPCGCVFRRPDGR